MPARGASSAETSARRVIWDLGDLYHGPDDPGIDVDRRRCFRSARRFARRYRGRVARLTAQELSRAVKALERIERLCRTMLSYAELLFAQDTGNPAAGRLRQSAREWQSALRRQTLFFELEWVRLPDRAARALLGDPRLAGCRHMLEKLRAFKAYRLDEPREQILTAKEPAGRAAWAALFDKTLSGLRHGRRRRHLQGMLADLQLPRRQARQQAALAIAKSLAPVVPVVAHILNTAALDTLTTARIRSYPHWLHERNLQNEIPDAAVAGLIRAVTGRYGLVQRYYRCKKKLLHLDDLHDYDRLAPWPGLYGAGYGWRDARALLIKAYRDFSPALAVAAELFFSRNWIHAAPAPGKAAGAFSHPTVPSCHPYVLMSFSGRLRDVLTLAHEIGHGTHQYLARSSGLFGAESAPAIAETAAAFSELLVCGRLIAEARTERTKMLRRADLLERFVETVFRQVAFYHFEHKLYRRRADSGELLAEQIADLWMETQGDLYGSSVCLGEHYRMWWACIPHFIHAPGYVYAYAFASLAALCLYERYRTAAGSGFAGLYHDFLKAGGSRRPHTLLGSLGIDPDPEGLCIQALDELEKILRELENSPDLTA